ncbi:MAG: DUF2239 family protein [Xanthobacteraceae bacterium]|nr:DUF2239 family protein [Xanthobacteraceae bacterium]
MTDQFTVFENNHRVATGSLAEVALVVKWMADRPGSTPILIFDDATGRPVDLDLRGSPAEVVARLRPAAHKPLSAPEPEPPRGRGRPKLGVVAREVTLLPRHWDWLATQPGGASVALRKLVEEARRRNGELDRARMARDAAYHFMSAMAGNLPGFEEASRALFAADRHRFAELIAPWPPDIRDHIVKLAFSDTAG